MQNPRFFEPQIFKTATHIDLSDDAVQHIRVLRLKNKAKVTLFNGHGGEVSATLIDIQKRSVTANIGDFHETTNESPLTLHLGQVISRGDRMEFVIQKAVELGISEITPLLSVRCGIKIKADRLEKKQQQWQKIAIAACEQSGRNIVPTINQVEQLGSWCKKETTAVKLTLHPRAQYSINTLPDEINNIHLLIGPEGGFTDEEVALTKTLNFIETQLGPRVLRTETAALTAITALQCRFGDLA